MKIKKGPSQIAFDIISYTLLAVASVICVIPFLLILSGSFTENATIVKEGYSLLPRDFSLSAYRTIFDSPKDILQAYKMTLFYTIVGTVTGLLMITLTAYVVSRKEFKYRNKMISPSKGISC